MAMFLKSRGVRSCRDRRLLSDEEEETSQSSSYTLGSQASQSIQEEDVSDTDESDYSDEDEEIDLEEEYPSDEDPSEGSDSDPRGILQIQTSLTTARATRMKQPRLSGLTIFKSLAIYPTVFRSDTHAFVLPTTHPGTSEAAGSRAGQGTGLSTSQATSPSSAIHQRQGSP